MTHLRIIDPPEVSADHVEIDGCTIMVRGKCGCSDTVLASANVSIGGVHLNAELRIDGSCTLPRGISISADKKKELEARAQQATIARLIELWAMQRGHGR